MQDSDHSRSSHSPSDGPFTGSGSGVSASQAGFKKGPIIGALVLALLLVVGVLVGAKYVFTNVALQPVAMTTIDSPDADSPECAALIEALPASLGGLDRAELADPAPRGAAAWQASSTQRHTLRCGVHLPLQFTALSTTKDVEGISWLKVMDTTPGSTMQTWYTVNTQPVVAVTTDEESLDGSEFPASELTGALGTLESVEQKPFPTPLTQLAAGSESRCEELLSALPDTIGTEVAYTRVEGVADDMAAWSAEGYEPIALRCGVAFPANYEAGAQLQSINAVPWFEDTTLGNGTTASTWFALGRTVDIAVSTPQGPAQAALSVFSDVISAHTDPAPEVRN